MYKKHIDNKYKHIIIDNLYSKVDLSKYRYNLLNTIERLENLKNIQHYVSPNYKGKNYLLILLKINKNNINNFPIACLIDRKKLSYHKTQIDINNIEIIELSMKFPDSLYNGTIFDGKLIQNNDYSTFIIQDSFYYKGHNMLSLNMISKINEIKSMLDTINHSSQLKLICNELYNYNNLKEIITNLNNSAYPTNGIIFYPMISGINILFIEKKVVNTHIINNISEANINYNIYEGNLINDYINTLKHRVYSYEISENKKKLWLSKTLTADVYDISENIYGEKLDIAAIPSLKISIMCEELIKDVPVQFNCVYSSKFNKWIPIEHC